jgi:hypothetical protein
VPQLHCFRLVFKLFCLVKSSSKNVKRGEKSIALTFVIVSLYNRTFSRSEISKVSETKKRTLLLGVSKVRNLKKILIQD